MGSRRGQAQAISARGGSDLPRSRALEKRGPPSKTEGFPHLWTRFPPCRTSKGTLESMSNLEHRRGCSDYVKGMAECVPISPLGHTAVFPHPTRSFNPLNPYRYENGYGKATRKVYIRLFGLNRLSYRIRLSMHSFLRDGMHVPCAHVRNPHSFAIAKRNLFQLGPKL